MRGHEELQPSHFLGPKQHKEVGFVIKTTTFWNPESSFGSFVFRTLCGLLVGHKFGDPIGPAMFELPNSRQKVYGVSRICKRCGKRRLEWDIR